MNDIKKTTLQTICLTMDYFKDLVRDCEHYETAFECVKAIKTLAEAYAIVDGGRK